MPPTNCALILNRPRQSLSESNRRDAQIVMQQSGRRIGADVLLGEGRESRRDTGGDHPARRRRAAHVAGQRDQREQRRFQRIEIRRDQEPAPHRGHQRGRGGERPRGDAAVRSNSVTKTMPRPVTSAAHRITINCSPNIWNSARDRVIRERRDDGEEVAVDQIAVEDAQRLRGGRAFIEQVGGAIEILQPIPRASGEHDGGADPLESISQRGRKAGHAKSLSKRLS